AHRSLACLEEERIGLLTLKDAFNYPTGSSLPSWGAEETDRCRWERITCDSMTKRVIQLSLNDTRQVEFLNASLFLPFQELQNLSLAGNFMTDFSLSLFPAPGNTIKSNSM
ncbi:unnamed protein product, partial [Ilex paraguariensis]